MRIQLDGLISIAMTRLLYVSMMEGVITKQQGVITRWYVSQSKPYTLVTSPPEH